MEQVRFPDRRDASHIAVQTHANKRLICLSAVAASKRPTNFRGVAAVRVECEQTGTFAADCTGQALQLRRVVFPDGARTA